MSSNSQTLGKLIWDARRKKGWSQREIAAKIGIDFVLYSKIENNRINPTKEIAQKLAYYLNVNLDFAWFCPNCKTTGWDKITGCGECGLSPGDLM